MLFHQRQRQPKIINAIRIQPITMSIVFIICIITFSISARSLYLSFTKSCEYPFKPSLPQILFGFGLIGSICSIIALISVSYYFENFEAI